MASEGKKGFKYHSRIQQDFRPQLVPGFEKERFFLEDVVSSEPNNKDKPISAGIYRMEKGEKPLVYKYTYDEMKIILEGEFMISDETGQSVRATAGDVFYMPAGASITFETPTHGLAFYVGQRPKDSG